MYYVQKIYDLPCDDETRRVVGILLCDKHPGYKGNNSNGIYYCFDYNGFFLVEHNCVINRDENHVKDILDVLSVMDKKGFTISNKLLKRFIDIINKEQELTNERAY